MKISDLQLVWKYRKVGISHLMRYGIADTYRQTRTALTPQNSANESTLRLLDFEAKQFLETEVLFVSSDFKSPSHAYRVDTLVAAFREIGIDASWVAAHNFVQWKEMPSSVKLVVFWRTNLQSHQHPVLEKNLKSVRFLTAYDTDDLTFDRDVYTLDNVAGLARVSRKHRNSLMVKVLEGQAAQIAESSFAIAGTKRLAESFSKLGVSSFDVPNVLPRWMEAQADELRASKSERKSEGFKIVYAGGTASHRKDFQSAWPALKQFLSDNEQVEFHIVGYSPLSPRMLNRKLAPRVITHSYVPHGQLLPFLAEFDLQIAPLELMNPFVEAKSAAKFMQGAAVSLPTIASPTTPFREVIESSVNGWLAETTDDWISALYEALDNQTRARVAEAAYVSFKRNHTVSAILPAVREIASHVTQSQVQQLASRKNNVSSVRKVAWVLPDLPAGSGGHRMVLRLAHFLPRGNFHSTVLILNTGLDDKKLADFAREHYGLSRFKITSDSSTISEMDFVFATHHSTVDVVRLLAPRHAKKCYLVQDFESLFSPMSESYLHALESYFDNNFSIICGSEWMSKKIFSITGRRVPYYVFPIDRKVYGSKSIGTTKRSGVLFFAKADTPRRLFNIGIEALKIVRKLEPLVPIGIFGGDPSLQIEGITNHGRLPTLRDLASLYKTYKIGVAFSTTNPSLIPYEMMACGLPVVDVQVRNDDFPKFGSPSTALLAKPDAVSVANEIVQLLNDREMWTELQNRGIELTAAMPTEDQIAETMGKFLLSL